MTILSRQLRNIHVLVTVPLVELWWALGLLLWQRLHYHDNVFVTMTMYSLLLTLVPLLWQYFITMTIFSRQFRNIHVLVSTWLYSCDTIYVTMTMSYDDDTVTMLLWLLFSWWFWGDCMLVTVSFAAILFSTWLIPQLSCCYVLHFLERECQVDRCKRWHYQESTTNIVL